MKIIIALGSVIFFTKQYVLLYSVPVLEEAGARIVNIKLSMPLVFLTLAQKTFFIAQRNESLGEWGATNHTFV